MKVEVEQKAAASASMQADLESDELLACMVESIKDYAVFALDLEGHITSWNPGAERLFGYTRVEAKGQPGEIIFTPEDVESNEAQKERARAAKEGRALDERWHIRKDGTRFWASGIVSPLRDKAGNLCGFVKVARDNTEHKMAEAEHQKLISIVEHSPDLMGFASLEGQPLYMNQAGLDLIGLDSIEALKQTQIIDYFFPTDHERIEREILPVIFGEGRWTGEINFRQLKTGTTIPVIWDVFTLRDPQTGEPTNLATVSREISSRKQAEAALRESKERLHIALETAHLGSWELDLATGTLYCSRICKANFGLPPDANFTYDQWVQMVHPDDRSTMQKAVQQALEGNTIYEGEYRIIWDDGSPHWIVASGRGVYDETGKPLRMVGVTLNITERKQAESERESLLIREQEARREAEAANRAKDEFLATLSHELRTPLNAILGWSRLLSSGHLAPTEVEAALKTIDRNAQAQAQLIEDILDVSRIVSGKLRLETRPVDLVAVVEAAIDTARPAAEAKHIQLRCEINPGVLTVLGDANRLQQVVWNLLSNAIKFTPSGGQVQVRLEHDAAQASIAVTDTGQGISPEFLPHVFDRFRQANSTSTRTHGGLGLGLAIVRHLAELHGGRALVASPGPGQGATFTIRLPLAVVNQAEDASVQAPDRRTSAREKDTFSCPPSLAGVRVLVVDDEPDARDLLVSVLTQCKAEVETAASVPEALAAIEQCPPDLLVTDIGMPDEDGYSLISKLRALPAERGGRIPAVALTAYARVEDRLRVLSAGFQMHVAKPVEPAELVAVLANLAAWQAKREPTL